MPIKYRWVLLRLYIFVLVFFSSGNSIVVLVSIRCQVLIEVLEKRDYLLRLDKVKSQAFKKGNDSSRFEKQQIAYRQQILSIFF